MGHHECVKLYEFLLYDKFDMKKVEDEIMIHMKDTFIKTKAELEKIYNIKIENLR
jgi:hypothetical protein